MCGSKPICDWDTLKCADCVAVNLKERENHNDDTYDACANNTQNAKICVEEGPNYGACEPFVCKSKQIRCIEGVLQVCFGNKWINDVENACTESQVCIDNGVETAHCQERACEATLSECRNNVLVSCDTRNNKEIEVDCGEEYCDSAAAECVERACSEDGTTCNNKSSPRVMSQTTL
ncbi:MAG: hypothetical protein ACOX8U_08850 [Bradymonadia bacterium]